MKFQTLDIDMEVMKASEFIALFNETVSSIGGDPDVVIKKSVPQGPRGRHIDVWEPACVRECECEIVSVESVDIGYSTADQKDLTWNHDRYTYAPKRVIEIF